MRNSVFLIFSLLLVSAILSLHMLFQQSLSPVDNLKSKIAEIEKEKTDLEFRSQILANQIADYQQHVATLIPSAMEGLSHEASYPLRQLASVTGASGKKLEIERASGLFEKAKTAFRDKNYVQSNQLFQDLIDLYPLSVHVGEAHFLLAEGHYQLAEFEDAIEVIERMIEAYPENELTGFALLRLGAIFEKQERIEDASDIYRAVLINFKEPAIVQQAKMSLNAVAL